MTTAPELKKQLKEHEKYDKWWNGLTLLQKQTFMAQVMPYKVNKPASEEVKAPLVNIVPMEGGPSFGKADKEE